MIGSSDGTFPKKYLLYIGLAIISVVFEDSTELALVSEPQVLLSASC